MKNKYIVVSQLEYAPEDIVTTWDDLAKECKERDMDISELHTEPLKDWLASGRKAYNYMYVFQRGPRKGQFKSAEELAAE